MLLPDLDCSFSLGKDGADTPKVDQYTIKVKTPKPLGPRGEPLKPPIEIKQDEIALKTYEKLRATGLNQQEIDTFATNTGLSVEEAIQLKSHIFLTKHVNIADWKNGKYYYEGYFDPDIDVAYGWEQAQRELTAEEKAWFRKLADHELAESKMMQEGLPLRDLRAWNPNKKVFDEKPEGAHEKAPEQPKEEFPGIKIKY